MSKNLSRSNAVNMRLFLDLPQESGEGSHGLEFPGARCVVSKS